MRIQQSAKLEIDNKKIAKKKIHLFEDILMTNSWDKEEIIIHCKAFRINRE